MYLSTIKKSDEFKSIFAEDYVFKRCWFTGMHLFKLSSALLWIIWLTTATLMMVLIQVLALLAYYILEIMVDFERLLLISNTFVMFMLYLSAMLLAKKTQQISYSQSKKIKHIADYAPWLMIAMLLYVLFKQEDYANLLMTASGMYSITLIFAIFYEVDGNGGTNISVEKQAQIKQLRTINYHLIKRRKKLFKAPEVNQQKLADLDALHKRTLALEDNMYHSVC